MLSRAGVNGNRKLILVLIQERTLLLVSGRIESSAFSLSLGSCSFSLAFSLVLLPSFLLSLSPSGSRLPSFLPLLACFLPSFLPSFLRWVVTRSSGKCTQNTVLVQPLPCVFVCSWALVRICIRANYLSLVRDLPSSNILTAAISVSSLQARHVRARFECPGTSPSHKMYKVFILHTVYIFNTLISLKQQECMYYFLKWLNK